MKEYTDSFLNETEKELLSLFYENEIMREAVKKVLLAGIYQNGTLKPGEPAKPVYNAAFSLVANRDANNEQIGADLRAMWEGVRVVENAFNSLSEYKKEAPKPEISNPAR